MIQTISKTSGSAQRGGVSATEIEFVKSGCCLSKIRFMTAKVFLRATGGYRALPAARFESQNYIIGFHYEGHTM